MKIGGYFVSSAAQAIGSFFAVALLVRLLGQEEFGRWAIVEPIIQIGSQIVLLGTSFGIIKLIAQDNIGLRNALRQVARKVWISVFGGAFLLVVAASLILKSGYWSWALGAWLVAESALLLTLSAFRGAEAAEGFVYSVLVRVTISLGGLAAFYYFGATYPHKVEQAALWWALAATMSFCVLLLKIQNRRNELPYDNLPNSAINDAIRYGMPIVLATVLAAVVNVGDRYILSSRVSALRVGEYAVMAKVASALNLLVMPVNLWWPTARFKHLRDDDSGDVFFARTSIQLVILYGTVSAFIWLISPAVVHLFSPKTTADPITVLALCGSAFCIGLTAPLNVGTLKEGQTHWSLYTVGLAAVVLIVLGTILVPLWEARGAAIATLISSMVSLVFQSIVSQRIHPIRYPYHVLLGLTLWIVLIAAVAYLYAQSIVIRVFLYSVGLVPMYWIMRTNLLPLEL